jgi:hypothetical protein
VWLGLASYRTRMVFCVRKRRRSYRDAIATLVPRIVANRGVIRRWRDNPNGAVPGSGYSVHPCAGTGNLP